MTDTSTPRYVVFGMFRGQRHYLMHQNSRVTVTPDRSAAYTFTSLDAALVASMVISTTHKLVDPGFEME
jgi:hypothetical protein